MASGQTLFTLFAGSEVPPASAFAGMGFVAGGSTQAEQYPVITFDSATQEYTDFMCVMPRAYAGGGLTLTCTFSSTATSGTVRLGAALRRINESSEDIDTSQTYDYNYFTAATIPGTSAQVLYEDITFTNGADMDSVAAGELFVLRVTRDVAGDSMAADARLHSIEVRET